jgi:hypothetical protein
MAAARRRIYSRNGEAGKTARAGSTGMKYSAGGRNRREPAWKFWGWGSVLAVASAMPARMAQ